MTRQEALLNTYQTNTRKATERTARAVQELNIDRFEVAAKYAREAMEALDTAAGAQIDLLGLIMKTKKLTLGDPDVF